MPCKRVHSIFTSKNRNPSVLAAALVLVLLSAAMVACESSDSNDDDPVAQVFSFGLAVANLNADTFPDVVTANTLNSGPPNPGSAKLILQDRNQVTNFAEGVFYEMGIDTRQIAAGDLNNDGLNDIVSSNLSDSSVRYRLQSMDVPGTFPEETALDTIIQPGAIAIADFNDDSLNDLAIAGSGLAGGRIMLNNPDDAGTFFDGPRIEVSGLGIASGDLDDDGRPDLVVGASTRNVVVLLQDPAPFPPGFFSSLPIEYPVDGLPTDIALDDIDGDGRVDIAVVTRGDVNQASISLLFQTRSPVDPGSFDSAVNYPISGNGSSIVIDHLNADGLLDIAATNELIDGGISILFQVEQSFPGLLPVFEQPAKLLRINLAYGLGADKINNDELTDLLTTNPDGTYIFYQNPLNPGSYQPPELIGGENP